MAKIIPDEFSYSSINSGGEERVYNSLKNNLNDDWFIYHSWRWLRHYRNNRNKPQGEGDFVIFHPSFGILVIEVKGGGIEYRDDGKYYSNSIVIQNPEKQASDTKFEIIARLREKNLSNICQVSHAVWFPDINWNQDFPPNLNNNTLLDEKALTDPEFNLKQIPPHDLIQIKDQEKIEEVKKIIHRSFKTIKSLRFRIEDGINEEIRLTNQQLSILEYVTNEKCFGVKGRAGTGKTLLAAHLAEEQVKLGEKVILLCFNKSLSEYLKNILSVENIDVYTFHAYALKYLRNYKPWRINFDDIDEKDFDLISKEFNEVIDENLDKYSVCLLDEAQDLSIESFNSLKACFSKELKFYYFFDPLQINYSREINIRDTHFYFGKTILELSKNMRNTIQVSQSALNVLDIRYDPIKEFSGIEGEYPGIIMINGNLFEELKKKLICLLNIEHIDRKQINILTMKKDEIIEIERFQVIPFRRFKGLENDIIIIINVGYNHFVDEIYRRELYISLTRSRYLTYLFINDEDSLMKMEFEKLIKPDLPNEDSILKFIKRSNFE